MFCGRTSFVARLTLLRLKIFPGYDYLHLSVHVVKQLVNLDNILILKTDNRYYILT